LNELKIPLPAGYTAELRETLTEPLSPENAAIGLDLITYRIGLYKNGQLRDIITTADMEEDLLRAVKEHIIETHHRHRTRRTRKRVPS